METSILFIMFVGGLECFRTGDEIGFVLWHVHKHARTRSY